MNRPQLRAEAIIRRSDGKAYLVQCDREESFYRFPGGAVEFGETAAEAIHRELLEEFDLPVQVGPLVCLNESLVEYDGRQRHDCTVLHWATVEELAIRGALTHKEHPDIQLTWRTLKELKERPLYPEGIWEALERGLEEVVHLVIRRNYDEPEE
ncbi:NUDIX domain-containing protein [Paenibacillus sp. CC-CFT747]|nr:NUDIX domain-containing protein [Paenibacillus sp. CC-CFT747]